MSVTWNYNGTNSLTVNAVGTAGEWYVIACVQDFVGPGFVLVQADGAGAFSGTFTGIADPGGPLDDPGSANHSFEATITHVSDSMATDLLGYFACNVFQYGEATTTGHATATIWTYDGSQTVSVDVPTFTGLDYRVNYTEHAGGGGGSWIAGSSAVHSGTGIVQTISVVMPFAPDPIQGLFEVNVSDPTSAFPGVQWTVDNRMFLSPATNLILGNPAISTDIKLVAVGGSSMTGSRVQTSPDGIYWTLQADPVASGDLFGVAFGNGTVVAVGDGGVLTSPDAVTWTARANPITTAGGTLFGVAYSPALTRWVAVGATAGIFITTSDDDGATWTARTTPWDFTGRLVQGVAWSAALGQWVAVGEGDDAVPYHVLMTSPDGITWTNQSTPMDGGNSVAGAFYADFLSEWVAVGAGNTFTLMTSPDGVTWTQRYVGGVGASGVANSTLALATASTTWFANSPILTSTDGVTWTPQVAPFAPSGAQGTDWDETLGWFAVAATTGLGMFLSANGVHWLGGFYAPGFFTPQDVVALQAVSPVVRCKGCGSGLLGTVSRT